MVTDIWLKRVENGASQILGKLNSVGKKGSQRKKQTHRAKHAGVTGMVRLQNMKF